MARLTGHQPKRSRIRNQSIFLNQNFKQMKQLTSAGIAKRKDIYKEITDFVINHLESGNVIWRKGWNSLGLPKNIITNHQYRGWNLYYLNFISLFYNYKT